MATTIAVQIAFQSNPKKRGSGANTHSLSAEQCIRIDDASQRLYVGRGEASFAHRQCSAFEFDHIGISPEHSSTFLHVVAPFVYDFVEAAVPDPSSDNVNAAAPSLSQIGGVISSNTVLVYGHHESDRKELFQYLATRTAEAVSQQVRIKNLQFAKTKYNQIDSPALELSFSLVDAYHPWGIADVLDPTSPLHDSNGVRTLNAHKRSNGSKGLAFVAPLRKPIGRPPRSVSHDAMDVGSALDLRQNLRILYRQADLVDHRRTSSAVLTFYCSSSLGSSLLHFVYLPEADSCLPSNRVGMQLSAIATTLQRLNECDDGRSDTNYRYDEASLLKSSSTIRVPMRESPVLMYLMQTEEYYNDEKSTSHRRSHVQDAEASRNLSDASFQRNRGTTRSATKSLGGISPSHADVSENQQLDGQVYTALPSVSIARRCLGNVALIVAVSCGIEYYSHVLSACHYAQRARRRNSRGKHLLRAPCSHDISQDVKDSSYESFDGQPQKNYRTFVSEEDEQQALDDEDEFHTQNGNNHDRDFLLGGSREPSAILRQPPSTNTTTILSPSKDDQEDDSQEDESFEREEAMIGSSRKYPRGVLERDSDNSPAGRCHHGEATVVLSPCTPSSAEKGLQTCLEDMQQFHSKSVSTQSTNTAPKEIPPSQTTTSTSTVMKDVCSAEVQTDRMRVSVTSVPASANVEPAEGKGASDDEMSSLGRLAASVSVVGHYCDEQDAASRQSATSMAKEPSQPAASVTSDDHYEFDFEVPDIDEFISRSQSVTQPSARGLSKSPGSSHRGILKSSNESSPNKPTGALTNSNVGSSSAITDAAPPPAAVVATAARDATVKGGGQNTLSPSPAVPLTLHTQFMSQRGTQSTASYSTTTTLDTNSVRQALLVESLEREKIDLYESLRVARDEMAVLTSQNLDLKRSLQEKDDHLQRLIASMEDTMNRQAHDYNELVESHAVQDNFYKRQLEESLRRHESTGRTMHDTILALSREKMALERQVIDLQNQLEPVRQASELTEKQRDEVLFLQSQLASVTKRFDVQRETLTAEALSWKKKFDEVNAHLQQQIRSKEETEATAELRKAEEVLRVELMIESKVREALHTQATELNAERKTRLAAEHELFQLRLQVVDLTSRLQFFEEKVAPEVDLSIKELEDQMAKIHEHRKRFQRTLHTTLTRTSNATSPQRHSEDGSDGDSPPGRWQAQLAATGDDEDSEKSSTKQALHSRTKYFDSTHNWL